MEEWEFRRFEKLLEENNHLLQEILDELKALNPPDTFPLAVSAKMVFATSGLVPVQRESS